VLEVLEVLEVSWRPHDKTTSLPPVAVCVILEVVGRLGRHGSRQTILIRLNIFILWLGWFDLARYNTGPVSRCNGAILMRF